MKSNNNYCKLRANAKQTVLASRKNFWLRSKCDLLATFLAAIPPGVARHRLITAMKRAPLCAFEANQFRMV